MASESESPLYDKLRPAGYSTLGAIRWNKEIMRRECTFPVLEQLLFDHNTGENKWVRVPIYPNDFQGEKPMRHTISGSDAAEDDDL